MRYSLTYFRYQGRLRERTLANGPRGPSRTINENDPGALEHALSGMSEIIPQAGEVV